jgi:superfamily II DNA helicase RecQ
MSLHCFFVPARAPEPAQSELNQFLAGHRVLAVHREWLADGAHSGWAFCVETVAGRGPLPPELKAGGARRGAEVDYKQVLSPPDFAVFSQLREVRKQLALAAGVPVYDVFTNEQLAAMVTGRVASRTALQDIEGIGVARADKFGAAVLAVLPAAWAAASAAGNPA